LTVTTKIDRHRYAAELCTGRRVLDVGGLGMVGPATEMPRLTLFYSIAIRLHRAMEALFYRAAVRKSGGAAAAAYNRIGELSSEYKVVDFQDLPGVDYVIDLNKKGSVDAVKAAVDDFRPEVILCMETLEHVNYHYEVMNVFAHAVSSYGTTVFITLPNNGNWVLNALGWNFDHSVAFFRDIAKRFVCRSDLGEHDVSCHACTAKYVWHWWIVYLISFGQPFSLGFTIRPKGAGEDER